MATTLAVVNHRTPNPIGCAMAPVALTGADATVALPPPLNTTGRPERRAKTGLNPVPEAAGVASLVIIAVIAALVPTFVNGANDNIKRVATLIGGRTMTFKKLARQRMAICAANVSSFGVRCWMLNGRRSPLCAQACGAAIPQHVMRRNE